MPKFIDLCGRKFGRLTPVYRCKNINGRSAWTCKCDCGNTVNVMSKSLLNSNTKSCGCLHKENVSKQFSKPVIGKKFGKLLVLEATNDRKHGSIVNKCLCDCGNIHFTTTEQLIAGNCLSCGCLHSLGNSKIKDILTDANIPFISEYQIRVNNINYYFDFALVDNNKKPIQMIEYDGILHFEYNKNRGWNNKENWEKTHRNDMIKNKWCFDNNIPILRIPYTDYKKLNLEYLKKEIKIL